MITVAGFIVVHRIGFKAPIVPGGIDIPLARLGDVFYGGVFRGPWHDVDYYYYRRELPGPLMDMAERMENDNRAYLGLEVCRDLHAALAMLSFTRSLGVESDLIAVRSPQLLQTKGRVAIGDGLVEWGGVDIITPGYGSLLKEGLFAKPELFRGWESALRPTGLLGESVSVDAYVEAYRPGVGAGELEDFLEPLPGYHIDSVQVGTVLDDRIPRASAST